MRGSLVSVKAAQSWLYCTMSSRWVFQKWESCPRSRSDFRRERCRVRVTLRSKGPGHSAGDTPRVPVPRGCRCVPHPPWRCFLAKSQHNRGFDLF